MRSILNVRDSLAILAALTAPVASACGVSQSGGSIVITTSASEKCSAKAMREEIKSAIVTNAPVRGTLGGGTSAATGSHDLVGDLHQNGLYRLGQVPRPMPETPRLVMPGTR